MRDVIDWDSGEYLGKIPEAAHTYSVVGNMNEFQLAIGETTYGGRDELTSQPGAIIDYGSLIYITLQRSHNAREAIITMGKLVQMFGYASEGESFSISDPNEVWIMEIIGKGKFDKGAVWVARRIPDGYVCGHANQARIQTFPLNDPDNCLYAADVVDFAKKMGYYPSSSPPEQFSFSDIYNPVTFTGARACEVRVWSFFRRVTTGMDDYLDYVKGANLAHRMPLWVKPTRKLTVNDTMEAMRDHLEGTWFDFRSDVGAQGFGLPYRWRPMDWTVDNVAYINERSTGTQQTGFSFVAQSRSWLPNPIGGILWFGVDDTGTTVYVPFYCGMTRIPQTWKQGNGDMMTFTFGSAFWVFSMVSNFAYTRYSIIYPDIAAKIVAYEKTYFAETSVLDLQAAQKYVSDPQGAIEMVTSYSVSKGDSLVSEWLDFWKFLFTKFMDGNVKYPNPGHQNPIVQWPGYPNAWYRRIVQETGDHYKVLGDAEGRRLKGV